MKIIGKIIYYNILSSLFIIIPAHLSSICKFHFDNRYDFISHPFHFHFCLCFAISAIVYFVFSFFIVENSGYFKIGFCSCNQGCESGMNWPGSVSNRQENSVTLNDKYQEKYLILDGFWIIIFRPDLSREPDPDTTIETGSGSPALIVL